MKKRLAFIFGTRPEAIKMAPLIKEVESRRYPLRALTILTGQHREIVRQVLSTFKIKPDYHLNVMMRDQRPSDVMVKVLEKLIEIFESEPVDMVLVQGDTTSSLAGALAAYYKKIPVAHIEAGLRTWDKYAPFPEELNRSLITVLADCHFAHTTLAKENLLRCGVPEDRIFVTGNTVIDALQAVADAAKKVELPVMKRLDPNKKIILVTVHRRESFGAPLMRICQAIKEVVKRLSEVEIIIPVHPNPNVRKTVYRELDSLQRVHLIAPVSYMPFLYLIQKSHLILTDSGGIIEEAPSFGKPVLILRDKTERPEAVQEGLAVLVGTEHDEIVKKTLWLLDDKGAYQQMKRAENPFGDGKAAERILTVLSALLGVSK
jgi:UDP-N-acetylglucosamine 2-epimerase (non-hydrolysing)